MWIPDPGSRMDIIQIRD
jgi:hypothetical protein